MSSKRLEELQKKLQSAEEQGGEPLTDEELEELEGGEDQVCDNNGNCHDSNSGCNPGCTPGGNP